MSSPGSYPTIPVIGSLYCYTPPAYPKDLLAHTEGFRRGGGKGTNQATALARLCDDKMRCAVSGRGGERRWLRRGTSGSAAEGVGVTAVGVEEGKSSGVAVILIRS